MSSAGEARGAWEQDSACWGQQWDDVQGRGAPVRSARGRLGQVSRGPENPCPALHLALRVSSMGLLQLLGPATP